MMGEGGCLAPVWGEPRGWGERSIGVAEILPKLKIKEFLGFWFLDFKGFLAFGDSKNTSMI